MNSCEEKSRGKFFIGIDCWIQEIFIVLVIGFSYKIYKNCKNVWENFLLILTYEHGKNLYMNDSLKIPCFKKMFYFRILNVF